MPAALTFDLALQEHLRALLMSHKMQALVCHEYGQPELLTLDQLPLPEIGEGQVLIANRHAGVSYVDTLMVADRHQNKHPLPFAPGMEVAGTVAAVGAGVQHLHEGDRVAALVYDGGFAQYSLAEVHECFELPSGVDTATAAGMLSVYLTAHLALSDAARLEKGERLVISGAAGGVGLAGVDLATHLGAEVVGIASTAEKRARVTALGATAIPADPEELRERLLQRFPESSKGPAGADVVLDPVAGALWKPLFRSLSWGGRYLVVGFAGGEIPQFPGNHLLVQQKSAIGFVLMTYRRYRHSLLQRAAQEIFERTAAGALRPLVQEPLPLAAGATALRSILDRKTMGKAVLEIPPA